MCVCVCVCVRRVDERLDFELAGYAKYLVLAGYLASYNDPRFDVDHFSAKTVGQAKKGGGRKFAQLKVHLNAIDSPKCRMCVVSCVVSCVVCRVSVSCVSVSCRAV